MPEASDNGDDNDSDEEDQDRDKYDLYIGAHFLLILKRNHVPMVGLL